MYYESIPQNPPITLDVKEVANRLKQSETSHITPFRYEVEGNYYLLVSDVNTNSSAFAESAVIRESDMMQIESLTIAWMETTEEIERYLIDSCINPHVMGKADLIIGNPKEDAQGWFECGCCGTSFKSGVKYQLTFDQDSGYGICPKCEHYYK